MVNFDLRKSAYLHIVFMVDKPFVSRPILDGHVWTMIFDKREE